MKFTARYKLIKIVDSMKLIENLNNCENILINFL